MIFITAKFKVKAEHAEAWVDLTQAFTEATRSEPGKIVSQAVDQDDWSELGELRVD